MSSPVSIRVIPLLEKILRLSSSAAFSLVDLVSIAKPWKVQMGERDQRWYPDGGFWVAQFCHDYVEGPVQIVVSLSQFYYTTA